MYLWCFGFLVSKYPTHEDAPSEDTKNDTDKDKEESKTTEASLTEPDDVPLASFVVDIPGEKDEEGNAESVM